MANEDTAPADAGAQDNPAADAAPAAPAAPAVEPPAPAPAPPPPPAPAPAPAVVVPAGAWFTSKFFPTIDAENGTRFEVSVPTYGLRTKWVEKQLAAGGLQEIADWPPPSVES